MRNFQRSLTQWWHINQASFFLFLILLLGIFFRLFNVNWDNGTFQHPDERFLAMVTGDMKIPVPKVTYFDQATSTFNPRNLGHPFFVYGTLPLTLNKFLALATDQTSLLEITLQGRVMSAFVDWLVIVLLFKMGELLEKPFGLKPAVKFWAALAYALAVLPIQQAHFFTTDTFMNTGAVAGVFFALKYYVSPKLKWVILAGISLGLALACKISAIFSLPLIGSLLLLRLIHQKPLLAKSTGIALLIPGLLFGLSLYLTLRIADPPLFAQPSFLNPQLSPAFLSNLQQLKSWEGPDVWFPPAIQWIAKPPVLFALKNLVVYGFGLALSFFAFLGIVRALKIVTLKTPARWLIIVLLVWLVSYFGYYSTQFVKSIRYFLLMYPFLAFFAGWGISWMQELLAHRSTISKSLVNLTLILAIAVWPLMFLSIYVKPITRITATYWMIRNVPNQSLVLYEYWDDALPIGSLTPPAKGITNQEVKIFDIDTPEKWQRITEQLANADYYVLSSNRGWGSIPTVPHKYPVATQFYHDLFSEKLGYTLVAEFTSYPSLEYLGIPLTFPDQWADEAFTVYDHPVVKIYQKVETNQ